MMILGTGHTIYQELVLPFLVSRLRNGILEQLHCHLAGHDLAIFNIALNHIAELATRSILLFPKQITCTEVLEPIVSHEIGALRSFSCTRTS